MRGDEGDAEESVARYLGGGGPGDLGGDPARGGEALGKEVRGRARARPALPAPGRREDPPGVHAARGDVQRRGGGAKERGRRERHRELHRRERERQGTPRRPLRGAEDRSHQARHTAHARHRQVRQGQERGDRGRPDVRADATPSLHLRDVAGVPRVIHRESRTGGRARTCCGAGGGGRPAPSSRFSNGLGADDDEVSVVVARERATRAIPERRKSRASSDTRARDARPSRGSRSRSRWRSTWCVRDVGDRGHSSRASRRALAGSAFRENRIALVAPSNTGRVARGFLIRPDDRPNPTPRALRRSRIACTSSASASRTSSPTTTSFDAVA